MNRRIHELSSWLKEQQHSFALITSTANVFYLSGFYCEPHERLLGTVVFPDGEAFLICPNMEVAQARSTGWQGVVIGYSDSDDPWGLLQQEIQKRTIAFDQVAIEKEHLTYYRAELLQNSFPGAVFQSVETKLHTMRMLKDDSELSILREAAEYADFGVEIGINAIKKGKSELEILATIEFELKKKGINKMSFSTMVLSGEKSADPHGHPGLKELQSGDFVLFDLGVVINGYCSDITRTVIIDEAKEEQQRIYQTVLQAQEAALSVSKPNTRAGDIDKTARTIIEQAGYGAHFPHRIGHGLGIDVHEYPSMSENNDTLLQKGMVFTIEPGIYVPNVGGVRIEDDVLVTDNGHECLTNYPKEMQIIK
ncbi:M24 family metallopeptidase [Anaerobacillus sp. MEB173]|uniref:M24 family metallopeptidase n=1 Tax=Anaerobacillus sp. MEB173 TaxID=3383345 RepID=UPI003F8E1E89